jgi:hypothetical protein
MAHAGACYLINSFARILSPQLASMLFPAILLPAFIGELSLAMWLTGKGVNVAGWQGRAGCRPYRGASDGALSRVRPIT